VEHKNVLARLQTYSAEDLRQQLAMAEEVGLGVSAPAVMNAHAAFVLDRQARGIPFLQNEATPLMQIRPDLACLPLRHGGGCQLTPAAAATLETLSRKLRVYLNSVGVADAGGRPGPALLREVLQKEMRGKRPEWLRPEAIPTMMQMLMAEEKPIRQILVDMLAEIPGSQSTVSLAQRAVFDIDAEVRRSAVAALKDRKAADYRAVFIRGLRYPWTAAADHAAEALVSLKDTRAVPEMVALLKLPHPSLPGIVNKNYSIFRDVVRTNHLNNCLLCHPPGANGTEPVLGLDPVLTVPANAGVATVVTQLQATPGSHNYGGNRTASTQVPVIVQVPLLVRGDVTYLRQDFSVRLPVNPQLSTQPGTTTARYDYVVRTRYVPTKAAQMLLEQLGEKSYPQRDSVLYALRTLTGKDLGSTSEAWLEAYPGAEDAAEAARLSRQLRQATAFQCEVMLNQYRDAKTEVHSTALALAIPGLKGNLQERARRFLVERLMRLSSKALCEKLCDGDSEMRRAVAEACQQKEKKELVPELLNMLADAEPVTVRSAEAVLKDLTGQSHASPVEWQRWWKKQ
jgi:HEAT repeat protein